MKTKIKFKLLAIGIAGIFYVQGVQGQNVTGLSGIGTNTCSAGTTGTDNTYVGCNAGFTTCNGCTTNVAVGKDALYNVAGYKNTMVGYQAGYNCPYTGHTFIGYQAGYTTSTGNVNDNTFIGKQSGYLNQNGGEHAFVGAESGYKNTSGCCNSYLGFLAGHENQTASNNTMVGTQAGYNNIVGQNTFVGYSSGNSNTLGTPNVALGVQSLYQNVTSNENVALGFDAMFSQSWPNGGVAYPTYNVAVGNYALYSNQPGSTSNGWQNTAIGFKSLYSNTTGANNMGAGYQAGFYNATGSNNAIFGQEAGYGVSGKNYSQNSFLGYRAGFSNTTAGNNVFTGYEAGYNNAYPQENVAVGHTALFTQSNYGANTTAFNTYNVAIGNQALYTTNPTATNNGYQNTAAGYQSGYSNTTGSANALIGMQASYYNTTGTSNCVMGYQAGYGVNASTTFLNNVIVGYQAGFKHTSARDGSFLGYQAGYSISSGAQNTCIGNQAGYLTTTQNGNTFSGNTSGYNNIANDNAFYGASSGYANTTGTKNTFIGTAADGGCAACSTLTNAAAIGYSAKVSQNNSLVLGGTSTYSVSVGIGTTTPSALLHLVNNANAQTKMFVENTSTGASAFSGVQLKNSTGSSYLYMTSTGYSGATPNALYVQNANGGDIVFYNNGEAMRILNNGRVGIGTATPGFTLDINGTANCTSNTWTSDSTKKKNINDLSLNALDIIKQLRPVTFEWKKVIDGGMKGMQMGFTAQELEKILPSIVITDTLKSTATSTVTPTMDSVKTTKSVKYIELFPLFVKAMQEQQKMIDSLFTLLKDTSKTNRVMQNNDKGKNNTDTLNIKLSLPNSSQLGDAQPNPNSGSTQIPYYIPENTNGAKIIFTDLLGRVMKEEILKAGYGLLNIDTQDLPGGIYNYSLIVEGKVIDNKKMMRNK